MSRADWSFLEHLLEEGQEYSTSIGRIWLTVLFLFRMLVLGAAVESAWDDEQTDFVCNTLQPGCTNVCYDKAFPISHFRYFVLQVIFVSTPTIFYFGYVAIKIGKDKQKGVVKDEKRAEEGGGSKKDCAVINRDIKNVTENSTVEKEKAEGDGKGRKADKSPDSHKLKGRFFCAYAFSILLKLLLEVGFIVGLWFLYGGFFMLARFECQQPPCRHTVDCFVSRPTEKTIFTVYTQAVAAVSVLLNLAEFLQLVVSHCLEKRYRVKHRVCLPLSRQVPLRDEAAELQTRSGAHLPIHGEATCYPNACGSYRDIETEVNWGSGEPGAELFPSYANCMEALRTSHSPRAHNKKQAHHTGKNTKGAHKGHTKLKQYV